MPDETTDVLDPQAATGIGSGASPGTTIAKTSTLAIAEQALDAVEAQRMRGLFSGIAVSSAATAVLAFFVGGDQQAMHTHAAALLGSALVCGGLSLLFRNPARYRPRLAVNVLDGQDAAMCTRSA